jgi:hypothetical protein
MRSYLVLLCALLSISDALAQQASDITAGEAIAQRYSYALLHGEIEKAINYAHPILRMRMGGDAGYEKAMQIGYASDPKLRIDKEQMGIPSEEFMDGSTRMFSIPIVRTLSSGRTQTLYYVLSSYDGGKSWKVFDLACTEARWLHAIAPTYAGIPAIILTADEANKLSDEQFLVSTRSSIVPKHPVAVVKRSP